MTVRLGSEYGGWEIAPSFLPEGAVVYSAGVGEDISFDAELLRSMNVKVLRLIDPTPGVLEHPRVAALPARECTIHLHPVALGDRDGFMTFWPPSRIDHASYSTVNVTARMPIEVPSVKLTTLYAKCRDSSIDLLKLDIEGAEYAVLDDLIASDVRPGQILVEFHHRFASIGCKQTEESIDKLRRAGFRLFAVSSTAEEFSFVHEDALRRLSTERTK